MRNLILQQITNALSIRNFFFIREQDIQLYLANYLINSNLFDRVFLEYHIPSLLINNYPWADSNNIYIDIVIEKDNLFYPIEIKYKTRAQLIPLLIFGQNENIILGQHGAQNIGCYDFWKDLKRLELFEQNFENVERGVMLFVSNDFTYQNAPLNQNVGYAQFSIHNGKNIPANTFLNWNGNLAVSNGRPGLTTIHPYMISWTPMQIEEHHYILI
jgi:hypothetical protein